MVQLMQLVRAATRRADKRQLDAWFNQQSHIEVPQIASSRQFTKTDFQATLTAFNRLHDWHHTHMHPCFPQLLGLAQHISTLAHKDSPFTPVGMVQTDNQICLHSPLRNDNLTIDCHVNDIGVKAQGISITIEIKVLQYGQCCVSATSTYLRRMTADTIASARTSSRRNTASESDAPSAGQREETLAFLEQCGRRYARVSGDYNPIHFHKWTARLLGYKSSIAHGMHVLARTLTRLEEQAPLSTSPSVITNRFLNPAPLPSQLTLQSSGGQDSPFHFSLINTSAPKRKQTLLTGEIQTSL